MGAIKETYLHPLLITLARAAHFTSDFKSQGDLSGLRQSLGDSQSRASHAGWPAWPPPASVRWQIFS